MIAFVILVNADILPLVDAFLAGVDDTFLLFDVCITNYKEVAGRPQRCSSLTPSYKVNGEVVFSSMVDVWNLVAMERTLGDASCHLRVKLWMTSAVRVSNLVLTIKPCMTATLFHDDLELMFWGVCDACMNAVKR